MSKAVVRMRFIGCVADTFRQKTTDVRRLVLPLFCWCAGFCMMSDDDLKLLRDGVRKMYDRRLLQDIASCLQP